MTPILAIDYGKKRTGIAITDNSRIIASALSTIETEKLYDFLCQYITKNNIEIAVVGLSKNLKNELNEIENEISSFLDKITQTLPALKIVRIDERFTSKIAFNSILQSGVNKKNRQNKSLIDQVSATLILQSYLESNS
jgi:putative holliday junction resolvase